MNRKQSGSTKVWDNRAVLYSTMVILAATLSPFSFYLNGMHGKLEQLSTMGLLRGNFIDFLLNIILFLPLGLCLTYLLKERGQGNVSVLSGVLLVSFGLSFAVEVLQLFLPSRTPSLLDVCSNTLGGVLGFICYGLWKDKILFYGSILIRKFNNLASVRNLLLSFLGYATVAFLLSIPLQRATNLSNWDLTFPFLLGNEKTGNRSWHGHIYQLQIANRAISEKEAASAFTDQSRSVSNDNHLLCSFQFRNGEVFDKQSGLLPEFVWKGGSPDRHGKDDLCLSDGYWLETAASATSLSRDIRRTNQFTLSATVATADLAQTGPARIISLSADPYHSNFTLGQQGSDLVIRIRTRLTEANGMKPALIVPDVFMNNKPRHLVITYDGSVLVFYIDGVKHSKFLELGPGAAMSSHVRALHTYERRPGKNLYYGLVFFPLGCLLVLIGGKLKWSTSLCFLVIGTGVFLPSFILEGILVFVSGKYFAMGNLLLGSSIIVFTMMLCKFIDHFSASEKIIN